MCPKINGKTTIQKCFQFTTNWVPLKKTNCEGGWRHASGDRYVENWMRLNRSKQNRNSSDSDSSGSNEEWKIKTKEERDRAVSTLYTDGWTNQVNKSTWTLVLACFNAILCSAVHSSNIERFMYFTRFFVFFLFSSSFSPYSFLSSSPSSSSSYIVKHAKHINRDPYCV